MNQWFATKIIEWYGHNKRNLPWRNTKNPYKIWLSEIILQQTRVEQGLPYYTRFIEAFPTVNDLAKAKEDRVLKLWQGLGYYSRARNLHTASKQIMRQFKGKFPEKHEDILKLKGVGNYTAAAISSFAFNTSKAVVDGNVYRLLSRVFRIHSPIDSTSGKKDFQALADLLIDEKNPGKFNQAIMEFGSQFCKPKNPDCENCIFNNKCLALKHNEVKTLPIKAGKVKVRTRYFNYFLIIDNKRTLIIKKRAEKDIWEGLYDFPLLETEKILTPAEITTSSHLQEYRKKQIKILEISKTYVHILSHQKIMCQFVLLKVSALHATRHKTANSKTLTKFAFPRLIELYINDCNLNDFL
ncbi:MAG: A/G-specific adenine glycosylase [Sphingobacteriaceae bacterium]|nr:A/G-specific adenine glycosylase [Sphingobacteriaceae bacterium]